MRAGACIKQQLVRFFLVEFEITLETV